MYVRHTTTDTYNVTHGQLSNLYICKQSISIQFYSFTERSSYLTKYFTQCQSTDLGRTSSRNWSASFEAFEHARRSYALSDYCACDVGPFTCCWSLVQVDLKDVDFWFGSYAFLLERFVGIRRKFLVFDRLVMIWNEIWFEMLMLIWPSHF